MTIVSSWIANAVGSKPYYARPTHFRAPHHLRREDYVEFFAVIAGSGEQTVLHRPTGVRTSIALEPGMLFLFRPDDEQAFRPGPQGLTTFNVAFPSEQWRDFAAVAGLDPSWNSAIEAPRARFRSDDAGVTSAFRTILDRFDAAPVRFDLIEFWSAVAPLVLALRTDPEGAHGIPGWLRQAIREFAREDHLRAGLPRLVELSHVSPQHLAASTRRYLGRTPTELVVDARLRRAAELLETTDEPVAVIARRCGFSTAPYFSACFRRARAMSPRQYRAGAATGLHPRLPDSGGFSRGNPPDPGKCALTVRARPRTG